MIKKVKYIEQLQQIITEYEQYVRQSKYKDLSDFPKSDSQSLIIRAITTIKRITGDRSAYSKEIDRILVLHPTLHEHIHNIIGIVKSLKYDIENDYLKSLIELVHADIFSDFLEMAYHLNNKGYKDAAAVITGSTLENHLKQLAIKHNIDLNNENGKPKKASSLNQELTKEGVYEKLDQKNVTAWLDLRNKAAHGHYGEYDKNQVNILIPSVRNFILRKPA